MSYVTGSHSVKVGYQHTLMTQDSIWTTNNQNLTYRFNNGVPNQLTQSISPWLNKSRTGWDAVFVQERWTRGRLTVQGAVRFDRARSWFPAQQEGPSRFLPVPIIVPETVGVDSYKDITPRLGASYDVFGDGRTALKVHLGRYLDGAGTSGIYLNTNPTMRVPQTTSRFGTSGVTRAWSDANGNFVPDCDLLNPNAQDLRASGGDLCGVVSNTSFGQYVLTNNFDPAILNGWGVRPSDWTLDVSVQRQILPRASATLSYSRRWFHGFTVADNLALQPSDLTPFSVVAPVDPRLPGGGGYVVSGLYDVVPDKAGQVSNLIAGSRNYGRWYQYFNGIDATLNLRAGGFTFIGGTSTGQTVADNCDVRAHLPELDTSTTGESPLGAGFASAPVSPAQPVLPCGLRRPDTVQGAGLIRVGGHRRSAVRHAPEQARNDAGGQLRRAERGRGAVARTRSVRERAERDGESGGARHDVRRSHQPVRRSRGQDSAARAVAHDGCARRLQRVELERGPHL